MSEKDWIYLPEQSHFFEIAIPIVTGRILTVLMLSDQEEGFYGICSETG
jgi:hypothetical protein